MACGHEHNVLRGADGEQGRASGGNERIWSTTQKELRHQAAVIAHKDSFASYMPVDDLPGVACSPKGYLVAPVNKAPQPIKGILDVWRDGMSPFSQRIAAL